jgi:Flp pilus assembly protein TadG
VGLFVFVALMAVVIDLGHLHAVRNEVKNAADAGALAGARYLLADPNTGALREFPWIAPLASLTANPPDCLQAVQKAQQGAQGNTSDGAGVTVLGSDVQKGWWDFNANTFTPKAGCTWAEVNAVQVTVRRAADTSGRVFLTLARVFGIQDAEVQAMSTAALLPEGNPNSLPMGPFNNLVIQQKYLESLKGSGTFLLNPDTTDNGFWGASDTAPIANASNLKKWINTGTSPEMPLDRGLNLEQGWMDSALKALADQLPLHAQQWTLPDGSTAFGWLVVIPVVDYKYQKKVMLPGAQPWLASFNPLHLALWLFEVRPAHACYGWSVPIKGVQPIVITNIVPTGHKKIEFKTFGNTTAVVGGQPGGSGSGGFGSLVTTRPKLVE